MLLNSALLAVRCWRVTFQKAYSTIWFVFKVCTLPILCTRCRSTRLTNHPEASSCTHSDRGLRLPSSICGNRRSVIRDSPLKLLFTRYIVRGLERYVVLGPQEGKAMSEAGVSADVPGLVAEIHISGVKEGIRRQTMNMYGQPYSQSWGGTPTAASTVSEHPGTAQYASANQAQSPKLQSE